jgi:hypothetical protein
MKRVPVESTNIESIGYDASSLTLEIAFTSGHVYQYFDVPPQVHTEFMAASSHGKFLSSEIKGRFRFARVS